MHSDFSMNRRVKRLVSSCFIQRAVTAEQCALIALSGRIPAANDIACSVSDRLWEVYALIELPACTVSAAVAVCS
jgi:hypothetical protein